MEKCVLCHIIPLKITNIQYFQGFTKPEMRIGRKVRNFVITCISPSQSKENFENYVGNMERNPLAPVVL